MTQKGSPNEWLERLARASKLASNPRYVRAPAEPPAGARHSAVLVLLGLGEAHEPALLLIRRADHLTHHAGQFGFPGGMQAAPDEPLEQTALRETYEEVGIAPADVETCGRLPVFTTASSNWRIQPIVSFLRPGIEAQELKPDPSEVAEAFWVKVSELSDPRHFIEETYERSGIRYVLPSYHLPGRRIWGATALMIHDFLERLERSGKLGA